MCKLLIYPRVIPNLRTHSEMPQDPEYDQLLEMYCKRIENKKTPLAPINILVNLYELDPKYRFAKQLGLGVFHSALEIFNMEIAFGGHRFQGTGCFFSAPLTMPEPAVFFK